MTDSFIDPPGPQAPRLFGVPHSIDHMSSMTSFLTRAEAIEFTAYDPSNDGLRCPLFIAPIVLTFALADSTFDLTKVERVAPDGEVSLIVSM